MAKSLEKTCLATLRAILGPQIGQEKPFAEKIRLSRSWLKKACCGKIDVTQRAATLISYATGIDRDWLYRGKNTNPIDKWGHPYTLESYKRNELALTTEGSSNPTEDTKKFAECIFALMEIFTSALHRNQARICLLELEKFVFNAKKLFGSQPPDLAQGIFSGLIHGLTKQLETIQAQERDKFGEETPSSIKPQ